jgi:hypothetical protein
MKKITYFKTGILLILMTVFLMSVSLLSGCSFTSDERIKLRDLDFTLLSEEVIPKELKNIIDEKQGQEFKLTYSDDENLYICIGYGEQPGGGYSITVNELYLTDNAIYVNTSLLKPETVSDEKSVQSYPYVVIKTEKLDQTVIFE